MRRFGIKSVLILVAIGAVFSAWLGYRHEHRPIAWVEYSEEELTGALDRGKLVFLFTDADWDTGPKWLERQVLDRVDVKRFLRTNKSIVCMRIDMTDSMPNAVPEVLEKHGVSLMHWSGNHPWFLIWDKGNEVDIFEPWVKSDIEFIQLIRERLQMNASSL